METITGRTFAGPQPVETDGTSFTECRFESVQLVYRGGEHPAFDRCSFSGEVSWLFQGPALKTIQLLQRIANDEGGENFIADMFEKGKFYADE